MGPNAVASFLVELADINPLCWCFSVASKQTELNKNLPGAGRSGGELWAVEGMGWFFLNIIGVGGGLVECHIG